MQSFQANEIVVLAGRLWFCPLSLPLHFNTLGPHFPLFFWIIDFFVPCPQLVFRGIEKESQEPEVGARKVKIQGAGRKGLPYRNTQMRATAHAWKRPEMSAWVVAELNGVGAGGI